MNEAQNEAQHQSLNCDMASQSQYFQIDITGQVQGVGFRPYIYQLATAFNLVGTIYNHGQGVTVLAKLPNPMALAQNTIKQFTEELCENLPPLASIETLKTHTLPHHIVKKIIVLPVPQTKEEIPLEHLSGFTIAQSKEGKIDTQITSDAATCPECLAELLDKNNRRFRYPFTNCTHCGPRYSIIEKLPYDRGVTTMKHFTMCASCQHEYDNVSDRRFHAQPNACAECGPSLVLFKSIKKQKLSLVNPLDCADQDFVETSINLIKQGNILAIKGIGGYHLVCDANNAQAVKRLRAKKQRKTKPLSIMMANVKALKTITDISTEAENYLTSSSAPITLVKRKVKKKVKSKNNQQAEQLDHLAPNMNSFGVMLPYTPLHHLLFQQQDKQGNYQVDESLCLVMTSANLRGAPLIYQEQELHHLASLSDYVLSHNRAIARRIDDSIVNCLNLSDESDDGVKNHDAIIIRRARGMAPKAITLVCDKENTNRKTIKSTLAVGGFLKNSVCLTKGNKAYLSQYIGDLGNPDNCRYLQQSVQDLMDMLQIKPEQVACDLHPDFYSSQFAQTFAKQHNIPLIAVQHHHAHSAAIACEHQLNKPYFSLSLDGVGLGSDGNAWGGECLFIEQGHFQRLGHFKHLSLPGADIAAKQPWRIATAFLMQHNLDELAEEKFSHQQGFDLVKQMITKQINCPTTSSAGRLFDLAAALLGLCDNNSFEAEAAMLLESAATSGKVINTDKLFTINKHKNKLDFTPLLLALPVMHPCDGAATFQYQLALGLVEWLMFLAKNKTTSTAQSECENVVLSGGCFLNAALTANVKRLLSGSGFTVFTAQQVSPNDSSLALGQAWVAIEQSLQNDKEFKTSSQSNTQSNGQSNMNQEGGAVCA